MLRWCVCHVTSDAAYEGRNRRFLQRTEREKSASLLGRTDWVVLNRSLSTAAALDK